MQPVSKFLSVDTFSAFPFTEIARYIFGNSRISFADIFQYSMYNTAKHAKERKCKRYALSRI
jgi:hypothetical protein